ncbi:hypothetical protein K470DRAFT_81519 [Piedraia hortae CBS 480.64]|uniref:S-adenosyl-L-methionine-dependent methyltransferase n=1 Tax=Piedraia hortae CBS 480.64 TaxID=1314780 RepID=A0A6A7C8K2_9PEZI|nr:hypothetical protein K470DRAFT_81519 [Piedraia hortae CBS 480.64]
MLTRHVSRGLRWSSGISRPGGTNPIPKQELPKTPGHPTIRPAHFVFSLLSLSLGLYAAQLYNLVRQPCHNPEIKHLSSQKDVAARYEDTAENFDTEVGISEVLMRINAKRKHLTQRCWGNVLEVSCGTGRNLGYYDVSKGGKVKSLTLVDLSPQMVAVCKRKWLALHGKKKHLDPGFVVRFVTGSALGDMPPPPGGRKYDTILQTMGLCSTAEPVRLLENMVGCLDTENPEARVFLLEHGRSYLPWLNNVLDNAAERHAEVHGCWFNRDIGELVRLAAERTGMEVVRERRFQFGTTWLFELKPKKKGDGSLLEKGGNTLTEKGRSDEQKSGKTSWNGLLK